MKIFFLIPSRCQERKQIATEPKPKIDNSRFSRRPFSASDESSSSSASLLMTCPVFSIKSSTCRDNPIRVRDAPTSGSDQVSYSEFGSPRSIGAVSDRVAPSHDRRDRRLGRSTLKKINLKILKPAETLYSLVRVL